MNLLMKIGAPIAVVVAGIAIIVGLSAGKAEPEKKDPVIRPLAMHVAPVKSGTSQLYVQSQGEVRPRHEILLVPQVSGRIVYIDRDFGEGSAVQPGQTLIKIDPSDYQLAVTRAKGRIAEAEVRLEQEEADARIKAEQWKNWVSDGEPTPLALNKPQVAEAKAKLEAARADLKAAELNLARTQISVPFEGRIREKKAGLGQLASAGQTLGIAYSTDLVEVRLPLTDEQLGDLGLPIGHQAVYGDGPEVTFTANLGGKTHDWTGYIVRTDAAIDPTTRLIYATAQVNDPYGSAASNNTPLAVGLFVKAAIKGKSIDNSLIIPRIALRGKNQVYIVSDDNKMEIRTVTVASTSTDEVILTSGVSAGEKVIISPVRTASNGLNVVAIDASKDTAETSSGAE